MENRGQNRVFILLLLLCVCATGCKSFLAEHAMKNYTVKVPANGPFIATNSYQEDFLYLKTLGEQVVPLEDHYFPPERRAAMEREIFHELGQPGCTHDTFVLCIRRYLAAFNNEHADIVFNPKPASHGRVYPFRIQYVSNEVCISAISSSNDPALLGQKITAINGHPVAEVEAKMFEYVGAENLWMRRAALEPYGYSWARMYRVTGLAASATNELRLEFAGHAPVSLAPMRIQDVHWQSLPRSFNLITGRRPHQYDYQVIGGQNFAYLQFNGCLDKAAILDGLHMVNPSIRPFVRLWLAIQFHRKHPSHVLDGIYDPDRPYLKDYMTAMVRDLNQRGITNLILDFRNNTGGETELNKQLLYFLTPRTDLVDAKVFDYNPALRAFDDPKSAREENAWYRKKFGVDPPMGKLLPTSASEDSFFHEETNRASIYYIPPDRPVYRGKMVVLANQGTHSAASLLAGLIQDNRLAPIVGTSTGNNPTGPTIMDPLKLPRSGIVVSLPTEYDERAVPANGEVLQPDYWVENSIVDNKLGRDAAFGKALELLGLGGDTLSERFNRARDFLHQLKTEGRQPGWASTAHGSIWLESYSGNIVLACVKAGDSSRYHYEVAPSSSKEGWTLLRAWRTAKNGRLLEEYPLAAAR
jgi:hypothetical protein